MKNVKFNLQATPPLALANGDSCVVLNLSDITVGDKTPNHFDLRKWMVYGDPTKGRFEPAPTGHPTILIHCKKEKLDLAGQEVSVSLSHSVEKHVTGNGKVTVSPMKMDFNLTIQPLHTAEGNKVIMFATPNHPLGDLLWELETNLDDEETPFDRGLASIKNSGLTVLSPVLTPGEHFITFSARPKLNAGTDAEPIKQKIAFTVAPAMPNSSGFGSPELMTSFSENLGEKLDTLSVSVKQVAGGVVDLVERMPLPGSTSRVSLQRTHQPALEDLTLWAIIERSSDSLKFHSFLNHIEISKISKAGISRFEQLSEVADEFLLREGVIADDAICLQNYLKEKLRTKSIPASEAEVTGAVKNFFTGAVSQDWEGLTVPYLQTVAEGIPVRCSESEDKLKSPFFIELIWNYWMESGMLCQTMNAISLRFQNKTPANGRNPLASFDLDPLRRMNAIVWGYVQDEYKRLTVPRRAYEYLHQYGLTLQGRAVPTQNPADSRPRFLECFHTLLRHCAAFFTTLDDATVFADGFPVLSSLKDLHLLLAEGAHNQYGDLAFTSRKEMLMEQWMLGRDETREFLRGKIMVPYQEKWMGCVDTAKKVHGWTDITITHFYNLAVWGERILLSVRFGNWNNNAVTAANAANWATYWRHDIQGYNHALRTVTGVDVNAPITNVGAASTLYQQPSFHIQNRRPRAA